MSVCPVQEQSNKHTEHIEEGRGTQVGKVGVGGGIRVMLTIYLASTYLQLSVCCFLFFVFRIILHHCRSLAF